MIRRAAAIGSQCVSPHLYFACMPWLSNASRGGGCVPGFPKAVRQHLCLITVLS